MKRFFYTLLALGVTVGIADAEGRRGGGRGGSSGGSNGGRVVSGGNGGGKSNGGKVIDSGAGKSVGDLGGKTQVFDKKIGEAGKIGDKIVDKKVVDKVVDKKIVDKKVGDIGKAPMDKKAGKGIGDKVAKIEKLEKFDLKGNTKIAKLPGFKADAVKHAAFCGKFGVPKHLHHHCYFHHDFCWNHHCWLPHYGCCGYWHPYAHCWYYWYEPWCCYLPYTYIETYRPVVVVVEQKVEQPMVVVNNVTNTDVSDNIEPMDPTMLPPGASPTLPPGVDPTIPAPKG
jgi:hypothetical protein